MNPANKEWKLVLWKLSFKVRDFKKQTSFWLMVEISIGLSYLFELICLSLFLFQILTRK